MFFIVVVVDNDDVAVVVDNVAVVFNAAVVVNDVVFDDVDFAVMFDAPALLHSKNLKGGVVNFELLWGGLQGLERVVHTYGCYC